MQYVIWINQGKCLEHWLNLSQGAVMSIMCNLSSRAESKCFGEVVYYWLSKWSIIEQIPLISESKNTFSLIIRQLLWKWLIERIESWNRSYYRLSDIWKTFCNEKKEWGKKSTPSEELDQGMEKNPQGYGKKSTLGMENFPPYTNTINTNTNNNINNNIYSEDEKIWNHNLSNNPNPSNPSSKDIEGIWSHISKDVPLVEAPPVPIPPQPPEPERPKVGRKSIEDLYYPTKEKVFRCSKERFDVLCADYSKTTVMQYVEKFENYCMSRWKTYKDHIATIRWWMIEKWIKKRTWI